MPSGGPEFDHAAAGSAPSANISAARSSTAASRRGADGAAAAAADDTAIPEVRHVASTSKVDAIARGSESLGDDADVLDVMASFGNRILAGRPVSRSAAANRRAAVLMPRLPLVPCPAGVGPPVLAALRSSLALVFGCSCHRPRGDPVRPEEPAACERHTRSQQPATGTVRQQEVQWVGPDELAKPHSEYR